MRRKDILSVVAIAAITATFVFAVAAPRWSTAEDEAKPLAATVFPPKMDVNGCEFTATTQADPEATDKPPRVILVATNTSDAQAAAKVTLTMTAQSPQSMMSRRLVLPTPVWTQECAVNLSPGESESFTYTPDAKIAAGSMVSIRMTSGDAANANSLLIPAGAIQAQVNGNITQALQQQ
jgi:CheY-like chemotaxis protein